MSSLLRLPAHPACTYRFVEVPSALHALRYSDVCRCLDDVKTLNPPRPRPLLATNIDVIFSTELVYLASGRLIRSSFDSIVMTSRRISRSTAGSTIR